MARRSTKGQAMVLGPEEGDSYWQPEPAHGYITVKVSPFNCDSNTVAAGFQVIDPGGHIRSHGHARNEEMLFVWEGHGLAVVDGVEHAVEPGSLVYVGRWVQHSIVNKGHGPLKVLWVILPPGLEDALAKIGAPRRPGEPRPGGLIRPPNAQEIYDQAWFAREEDLKELERRNEPQP